MLFSAKKQIAGVIFIILAFYCGCNLKGGSGNRISYLSKTDIGAKSRVNNRVNLILTSIRKNLGGLRKDFNIRVDINSVPEQKFQIEQNDKLILIKLKNDKMVYDSNVLVKLIQSLTLYSFHLDNSSSNMDAVFWISAGIMSEITFAEKFGTLKLSGSTLPIIHYFKANDIYLDFSAGIDNFPTWVDTGDPFFEFYREISLVVMKAVLEAGNSSEIMNRYIVEVCRKGQNLTKSDILFSSIFGGLSTLNQKQTLEVIKIKINRHLNEKAVDYSINPRLPLNSVDSLKEVNQVFKVTAMINSDDPLEKFFSLNELSLYFDKLIEPDKVIDNKISELIRLKHRTNSKLYKPVDGLISLLAELKSNHNTNQINERIHFLKYQFYMELENLNTIDSMVEKLNESLVPQKLYVDLYLSVIENEVPILKQACPELYSWMELEDRI